MRLSTVLVAAPAALFGIVFAIANRQPVRVSLNPFDPADGALGVTMPLFVALFLAVLLGMLVAGLAVWIAQGRWRRRARREHREVERLQRAAARAQAEPDRGGSAASV